VDWFLRPESFVDKILVMIVAVLLFVVVLSAILWLVDREKTPKWLVAVGFIGPVTLALIIGLLYPALKTVYRSFQVSSVVLGENGKPIIDRQTGQRQTELTFSLDNYGTVFSTSDFQKVLINTALWVILVPIIATVFGLVYAVLVDRTRFEKVAKALIFLPMAISMVGASIIWKFVYDYKQAGAPQIGLANQILVWLGLDPYQFLITEPWNTLFLIVVMIWIQAGFAMTLLSAAIKAVPDDIIEAAQLDGATGWQQFIKVTVPSVRPAIVVVLTTIAMATLKAFDIVRTMTGGQFGTSVVANEFYTQSFRQGEGGVGIGAALAVILFVIIIPVIAYNVRQMRLVEETR
jgi:alpha-glucoside transport system permease protein